MGEIDRRNEIEIRTLTGESTTVLISPNTTIQELKSILKQSFPPASSSPNFHLFLKGVKLSLQSQISSHLDGCGEFIVLVPFTKRAPQQTQKPDENAKTSEDSNQCSTSKLAESAWSDMMQDLSSLQQVPSSENQPYVDSRSTHSEGRREEKKRNCDSGFNLELQDLLLNILQSQDINKLDEKSCISFFQVLESINCLSDSQAGHCMLTDVSTFMKSNDFCSCPPWLKRFTKGFYFVNIYSGFLLFQRQKVTLSSLEGVLDQLMKLGLDVRNSDLEHLSVVCPRIVRFVNDEKEGSKLRNVIVIFRSSEDPTDKQKASRQMPISKVMDAMRKREETFKTDMWKAVKSFMDKNDKSGVESFSLEDLLLSVDQGGRMATKNERKRAIRNWTEPSSSYSSEAQCNETNPLLPLEMVEHLRKGIGARGQIVHLEEIKGREANFVEVPSELSENTRSALKSIGVTRLYSHQAESIQASLAGKNVIVATMTSSGKSLCYNIPVLEVLSQNLLACALYLFPTKALAQDQLRAVLSLSKDFKVDLNIGIYDGDTPQEDRLWLRDNTRLLITNPDMLHMSVLPFHGQFRRILSNLRFVIIDEAHIYKGAFGCHSALILRRLRRLCAHVYGSDPSFIFCTATSANPREHAMELAGLPAMELIQNDGSPSAPKLFALWNPPLCLKTVAKRTKSAVGSRRSGDKINVTRRSSPILEVSRLFSEMVQHGLRCIAFCKTRKLCELVLCYTREILQETAPHLVNSICSYRGGYVAQDRRRIESDFFGGNLFGVTATNALELGIDVGHIDVTLHLGFPGSIASLWQQAGRSGRREKPSLAVYVAFEGPLDQYFMKFPQKLFRGPIECCHVDAKNPQVLEQHLMCAALEHPLSLFHDEKYFGPSLKNSVMSLKGSGFLSTDPSRDPSAEIWNYIGPEKTPSRNVSIRAIENERYKVIDMQKYEVLEEIEESKAFFQVYEGSVYLHQGKTYLVKNLDLTSKIALCQEADLKYYTKTRDYTDVHVIGGNIAYQARNSDIQYSKTTAQTNICNVTTTWFGFRRIQKGSNRVIDTVELSLPSYSYKSQAVWIRVPQSIKTAVESKMYSFRGGLHAAGHALLNVVPLYIICSTSDLASECVNPYETRYAPERILLYDSRPGGTGISAQVRPLFTELLTAALELLTSCDCSDDAGCPNCVQNLACHEYNEVLHKDAAVMIIKGVVDSEKSKMSTCS